MENSIALSSATRSIPKAITNILDVQRRQDIVIVYRADYANPTGSTEDNAPMSDIEGYGIASAASMGHRINKTAQMLYQANLYYDEGNVLETLQKPYKSANEVCLAYWDRVGRGGFYPKIGKGGSSRDSVLKYFSARSVAPVDIINVGVSPSAVAKDGDSGALGNAQFVGLSAYKGFVTLEPHTNAKYDYPVTPEWFAQWLVSLHQHTIMTHSLQRGDWSMHEAYIVTHKRSIACMQQSRILDMVSVQVNPSDRTFEVIEKFGDSPNYEVTRLSDAIEDLIIYQPIAELTADLAQEAA